MCRVVSVLCAPESMDSEKLGSKFSLVWLLIHTLNAFRDTCPATSGCNGRAPRAIHPVFCYFHPVLPESLRLRILASMHSDAYAFILIHSAPQKESSV